MNCMKCGREIPDNQVFCDGCMADMQKYPVKPDVVVTLPSRPEPAARKNLRSRPPLSEQDQIRALKKRLRNLYGVCFALIILVGVLSWFGFHLLERSQGPLLGQNYSTVSTKATDPAETTE